MRGRETVKKILMIATGGTIASEMTPSGLAPELNPQQLLKTYEAF